jgi:hypothetical protein
VSKPGQRLYDRASASSLSAPFSPLSHPLGCTARCYVWCHLSPSHKPALLLSQASGQEP